MDVYLHYDADYPDILMDVYLHYDAEYLDIIMGVYLHYDAGYLDIIMDVYLHCDAEYLDITMDVYLHYDAEYLDIIVGNLKSRKMALRAVMVVLVLIAGHTYGRVAPYPYHIASVHEAFEGHIHQDAIIGSKVPKLHHERERSWGRDSEHFLTLTGITHVEVDGHKEQPHTPPPNVQYKVIGTHFFTVKHRFIVVANNTNLPRADNIEFYVVLVTDRGEIVSNPVPFVVDVFEDMDVDDGIVEGTTIFAGALVVLVIIFAFVIPCVVRAKRRYKAGKPICIFGGVEDDLTKLKRSESKEPNWYGLNIAYDYKDEVKKQTDLFTKDMVEVAEHSSNRNSAEIPETRRPKLHWIHPHFEEPSYVTDGSSPMDDGPIMFSCNGVPKGILKNCSRSTSSDSSVVSNSYRRFSDSSSGSVDSRSLKGILKNGNAKKVLSSIGENKTDNKDVVIHSNGAVQYDSKSKLSGESGDSASVSSGGLDNPAFDEEMSRL
ncbi:hypothetical protein ScPMuIL_008523 [Solemya velum]